MLKMKIILPVRSTVITYQAAKPEGSVALAYCQMIEDRRLHAVLLACERERTSTAVCKKGTETAQHLISIPITVRERSRIKSS